MMLPSEHIRVFRRRDVIKPLLIEGQTSLAKTLIAVYKDNIGWSRGEIEEALSDCEELGYDFKLVRGFSDVLEARSVFKMDAKVAPLIAREEVFKEAANYVVTDENDRLRVMNEVSGKLGVTVETLEKSLYADLEYEQTLTEFKEPTAEELNKYYNYANTVTLLTYARKISVSFRGVGDDLLTLAERLGDTKVVLNTRSTSYVVQLESTNRLANRGAKIDEFLEGLLRATDWDLEAEIVYPPRNKKKSTFKMNKTDYGYLIEKDPIEQELIIEIMAFPKKPTYGELIIVEDLARKQGVTESEIYKQIKKENIDYKDLGGVLVSSKKLNELRSALQGVKTINEAKRLLKTQGVSNFIPVLQALGYQVDWVKPRGESRIYRL